MSTINPPSEKRASKNFVVVAIGDLTGTDERRNSFLDVLRTLAIFLVVNGHVSELTQNVLGASAWTNSPLVRNGWTGVDLFFVLSGFFIGTQLWKELFDTGTISFSRFILRRGLRIWPLYFFILFAMIVTYPTIALRRQYGITDALFITNYLTTPEGLVNGSWSLCIEEQFYILTPLILKLVGRQSTKIFVIGLITLLGAEIAFRAIDFHLLTGSYSGHSQSAMKVMYYPLHTHSDGLIVGLLIAVISLNPVNRVPILPLAIFLAGLGIVAATALLGLNYLEFTALALIYGSAVTAGVWYRIRIFGKVVFQILSRLSFGMYLNHECISWSLVSPVGKFLSRNFHNSSIAAIGVVITVLICSSVASVITFCLIEHQFLALRTVIFDRLSKYLPSAPRLIAR